MMQNWPWRSRETAADVMEVSQLFLVLRHAINADSSKGRTGELGSSASHVDSLDSGLGIKELTPGISPVVE
jgi:hypothetical protein